MDYTTVILLRRSGNINHDKNNLRRFLKTKKVICVFKLICYCSQAQSLQMFLWLSWVPSKQYFPPPCLFSAVTPLKLFPFRPSTLTQMTDHCHPPYSEFTDSIIACLTAVAHLLSDPLYNFFLRPFLTFSIAGAPVQWGQQLQEPRHHLWLDLEPLQAARKP